MTKPYIDTMSTDQLNERAQEIFRQIVEIYLESGLPVGSRNLSRILELKLSPASIRNVMSDLEEMGLIYAPHISAGRVPTEQGLRFFVDALLEIGNLAEKERLKIDAQVLKSSHGDDTEKLFIEASAMLSGLSKGAGLVLTAKRDLPLKHIEFVRIENGRALVILVADDGSVENRIIDIPAGMPAAALISASNYLNTHLRGRNIDETKHDLKKLMRHQRQELDSLTQKLVQAGLATWAEVVEENGRVQRNLIVRGRSNLLDGVSAEEGLERIRLLFDDLESKSDLMDLLGSTQEGRGVRIFIGSENNLFSLSGSSLVVAPYLNAQQEIIGALGVIGPTRLNYGRIIPVVDYTAQLMGKMLR